MHTATAGRVLQANKPRVSHQSPPSTRFQPPRVKSDMSDAAGGGRMGASTRAQGHTGTLDEGHPRAGAQMQQPDAWNLEKREARGRERAIWAIVGNGFPVC